MEVKKEYTLKSKIGYGLGDVANGGAFTLLGLLYLNFLVSVEGMNPALAGLVVMIARIWDAFTDPLMGVISDRTRSRFGRRRVYLLFGAIPLFVTFVLLWHSFGIVDPFGKFIYYTLMYMGFSTAIAVTAVPYNALLPDMVEGYKERTGYITVRMLVSNIAGTIAVTTPALILGSEATRTTTDFLIMGIVFGLFFAIPLVLCFFMTWENPLPTTTSVRPGLRATMKEFGSSFNNKSFRQYLGIFVFGQVATDIGTAVTAFWLADVMLMGDFLMIASGIVMVSALSMLPINNWLSKKHGKHYPIFIMLPIRVLVLLIAFFLTPSSPLMLLIIICVGTGIGAGSISYVSWVILPDMPDTNELIHGAKNAGVFGAIATFARNFTSGISIFFVGIMLNAFGYVESVAGVTVEQTPLALTGVRITFAAIPLLLTIITIFIGMRFGLTKKGHQQIRAAIDYKQKFNKPIQDEEIIAACEKISGSRFSEIWAGCDK